MKTITFISLIIFSLFLVNRTQAQSLNLISDVHIFLEPTTPHIVDTTLINNPATLTTHFTGFNDNEEFKLSVSVLLIDTSEVYKVYIKAGRTQGGSGLFDSYFEYDDYTPTNGLSYSREQKHLILGLGNFINLRNIYTEIYIESTSGETTQHIFKHINQ